MRKLILAVQKVLMITGLLASVTTIGLRAQTLTMPSGSGTSAIYFATATELGVNTAMITRIYSGHPWFFGYTCYDASGGTFDVVEPGLGSVGPITLSGTPTGTPDIIIGNTIGAPTTDFIVAIAFPTSSGVTVDFARIYNDGTTCSLATSYSSVSYMCSPTTVHIDIIAQHSVLGYTSMPFCNKFILTWDEGGSVYAAYGTLADAAASTFSISPQFIDYGKSPDVAAIERTVSASTHNVGMITYTSTSDDYLYITDWDVTAASVGSPTTLDNVTGPDNIMIPRIDGDDNKATNSPSGPFAIYKVVAEVDSSTYKIIRTYDNLTAGTASPSWTSSSVIDLMGVYSVPPPYMHYAPTVAFCGPPPGGGSATDGTHYMVQHYTDEASYGNDMVMMEPIEYTASYYLAYVMAVDQYYWVSDGPGLVGSSGGVYANSISSSCNNVANNSISAWVYPNFTYGGTDVLYKFSPYAYAYKPDDEMSSNGNKNWNIYPNPATDLFTITNPAGNGVKAGFEVVDMAGRSMLEGKLTLAKTDVSLASLPNGTYLLRLHREDGEGKNQMFVKK